MTQRIKKQSAQRLANSELAEHYFLKGVLTGRFPNDPACRDFVQSVVDHFAAQNTRKPRRAAHALAAFFETPDDRDPGGVKETYKELISASYHGATKEKPASGVGNYTRVAGRADALTVSNWDNPKLKAEISAFLGVLAYGRTSAKKVAGVRDKATTRDGREIERAAKRTINSDYWLLQESLAGLPWHRVQPILAAWRSRRRPPSREEFHALCCVTLLSETTKALRIDLAKQRLPQTKVVKVHGKAKRVRLPGKPRKRGSRGPYKPRSSARFEM